MEGNVLDIRNFNNETFGEVRVMMIGNEPWFVAADVCRALDLSNPTIALSRLDDDEKMTLSSNEGHSGQRGGAQSLNVVNESGLYSLVLGSRKPEAKAFKRWITHDVIPAIRKTGGYILGEENLSEDELVFRALQVMQRKVEMLRSENAKLENKNQEMAPKALFADAVEASGDVISIGQLAKMLKQNGVEMGQNRLFEWLRDHKYLMAGGLQHNMPTQRAMNLGLFKVKERTVTNPDGSVRLTRTTLVTGKGQQYFVNKFLRKAENA